MFKKLNAIKMKKIFTLSDNAKLEYSCTVIQIGEVKPIEGSDFLAQTLVNGNPVVIRKDMIKEGDVMVYAPIETVLNKQFLSINNLYELGVYEMNDNAKQVAKLIDEGKRDEAKRMVGFFNKHGRVKMIRLRGCPSMGFLIEKESLVKWKPLLNDVDLNEYVGQDFDTIDDELFVKVYIPYTPQLPTRRSKTNKAEKKIRRFSRIIDGEFKLHYETSQLQRSVHYIKPDDKVFISNKLHGCVERDTLVDTFEYGKKTIGEIVDNKIECHIKAYDTETNSIVYVPIDNYYYMPNDGEWYEIELEDERKIIITGNNPVWLPVENLYRRVDELRGNEYVLVD